MRSWRWRDWVLLGMALCIALGCCGVAGYRALTWVRGVLNPPQQDPLTNPRVVALLHLPEYQLVYPGAVLLGHSVQAPSSRPFDREPASAGKTYGLPAPIPAQVTDQAIMAWYTQQLQARGWTPTSGGRLSDYSVNSYWSNGSATVLIGVFTLTFIQHYEPSIDTITYPLVFQLLFFG